MAQDISSATGVYRNYTPQVVIHVAKKQYADMFADKSWDMLGPHQAQMVALTTQLIDIKLADARVSNSNSNTGNDVVRQNHHNNSGPEDW